MSGGKWGAFDTEWGITRFEPQGVRRWCLLRRFPWYTFQKLGRRFRQVRARDEKRRVGECRRRRMDRTHWSWPGKKRCILSPTPRKAPPH